MPNRKKRMAAPAQGFLPQADAARFCGTSVDTVQRATKLWTASAGRYGLRWRPRGARMKSYAVADLVAWVDAGMPTGYHRDEDGAIRQVAF